jgi:nucleoside-diphosphate-sugar epimerase
MNDNNIFLTGGTGFIGRHLVKELVGKGYNVTCLIRNPKKKKVFLNDDINFIVGNLQNVEKVKKDITGHDFVYHLAAIRGEYNIPWEHYYKINVEATRKLFEMSIMSGISKFLYISSVGVYGTSPIIVPADAQTQYNPDSKYHKSKMLAEKILLQKSHLLDTLIIRPTITYGSYDRGFLYRLAQYVKKGVFPIFNHGNNLVHLLYVKGLVEGLIKLMEIETKSKIFIFADHNPIKFKKLLKLIALPLKKEIKTLKMPHMSTLTFFKLIDRVITPIIKWPSTEISYKLLSLPWFYDIEKSIKEIGYQPYQTEKMIHNTISWYIQHGWL